MVETFGRAKSRFWEIFESLDKTKISEFDAFLKKFAVDFNLYKNGEFIERAFPFDLIPRIIEKSEFETLERGIAQRIEALNLFLGDVYGEQKIIKDGVVPTEFVHTAKAFLPAFIGVEPPKNIRTHISGIDLVKDTKTNDWIILEDNLRVPSGASYPLSIRKAYRKVYPEFFENLEISKVKFYPKYLEEAMNHVNCGGINVVLTPGRYNSAYYEHSYLAKEADARLATSADLEVEGGKLYFKNYNGQKIRVGAVYRRLDDDFLDPLEFRGDSLIGVAGITSAYRAGNVAIMNAIGNGVADDKGIYYFVPKMIRYYLGEEPILKNAPTYLPYYDEDKKYVFENMEKLVIKDVAEAGGYGVMFGSKMSREEIVNLKNIISKEPRRFIAQELIEFYDIECLIDGKLAPRKSDFRAYVIKGENIKLFNGGLTRYALEAGNYLVNSSQGGGFKDTWIVGEPK